MASTTFVNGQTLIEASWLNDVNDAVYNPAAAIIPASSIVNTPAGNIAATDVQTALNELDTEKQPLDATLTALAGLATGADKLAYSTGTDTFGQTTLTAFSRTLLDDVDAATARATLGTNDAANITTGNLAAARILSALNATGPAPIYACRAWVNFNGTGTVAIRASGNVSSITDNGTGDYTVNFTSAMPDANYCVCGTVTNNTYSTVSDNSIRAVSPLAGGYAAGSVRVYTKFVNPTASGQEDQDYITISIFR